MTVKAVFLDFASVNPDKLNLDYFKGSVDEWEFYDYTAPEDVADRIAGVDIVVTNKSLITSGVLSVSPDLKLVAVLATGYNNVDVKAANDLNVSVCNARGYSVNSVVQHVFSMILALNMNIIGYDSAVSAGKWQKNRDFCFFDFPIEEISGKKLGIFGYGSLGTAVAKVGEAFGMEILIAERKGADNIRAGRASFDEVVKQADILTLHCPLNDETKDLIDENEFLNMKKTSFLINVARGGVVNENSLANALKKGEIAGAATDVLSVEPPKDGNVLLGTDIPNLIITPHVAWASRQARQRLIDQVADNIRAFLKGEPQNIVS